MTQIDPGFHRNLLEAFDAGPRLKAQQEARNLLLATHPDQPLPSEEADTALRQQLADHLEPAASICTLTEVQREAYHNDSGTAALPGAIRRALINTHETCVVRPSTLAALQEFAAFCYQRQIPYTIRGAGTWPFGGALPLNGDVILDLSYLDLCHLSPDQTLLTVGPGTILSTVRTHLQEKGFALRQDITNPKSGTLCGWIVTGGYGLGAYKYGPIRDSVAYLLVVQPDGRLKTLLPGTEEFAEVFGSEGQLGILAGAVVRVRRETHHSKPHAFSFESLEDVLALVGHIEAWGLQPASLLYFSDTHIDITVKIQLERDEDALKKALEARDEFQIARCSRALDTTRKMVGLDHVLVMHFDSDADHQASLRHPPFRQLAGPGRYLETTYVRLETDVAHRLWDQRYAPVEMKSKGPSMLVSEAIVPLSAFRRYVGFVEAAVGNWTGNPVKTEAHFLSQEQVLVQSIILADTRTLRHKLYLILVPFMTQVAVELGGRPYGIGLWNLPFLKQLREATDGRSTPGTESPLDGLNLPQREARKAQRDPHKLLNQSKFINDRGRNLTLRLFTAFAAAFVGLAVRLLIRGWDAKHATEGPDWFSAARWLWRFNKRVFKVVVPPEVGFAGEPILEINSPCVECDSCERVCPTSDVFGLLGPATPITRRKTANRIGKGQTITRTEALGFLACTRCDACTRACPTDIPLTAMFDRVEADPRFQAALDMSAREKSVFLERMWTIMKESPLYVAHTLAAQKLDRSHLEHGLKIQHPRGFPHARLFIDPETCINCGMCAHENACMYEARVAAPRSIPTLVDANCALCNACINFCPQNKAIQAERTHRTQLAEAAVDMEEQAYWTRTLAELRDTTTVQRAPVLTELADIYFTENVVIEIDREASTGQIPVSGMGQGDRHMGIGFDAERFSHFHIVGPAQNRLHEGDPAEELSVLLGKRHRYCKFDQAGELDNPPFHKLRLGTPMLYDAIPLESNGQVESAFIRVADANQTLVVMTLARFLEHYDTFLELGGYTALPRVIVPRVGPQMMDLLRVTPNITRQVLDDLWHMPMFEVVPHRFMADTIHYLRDSARHTTGEPLLICGYLEVAESDIVAGALLPDTRERLEAFMALDVDVIHVRGLVNREHYYVTSEAVRAIHHHLLSGGRRHRVSLVASGGIRLASDSQKTVQRGAEATLIDTAALLALDPYAHKAISDGKRTSDRLMNLDHAQAVTRLSNQLESRKVQILEVLGASGFKDIKKTVGEEGRLIDFYDLEARIQTEVFDRKDRLDAYDRLNEALMASEPNVRSHAIPYSSLKQRLEPLRSPHTFYQLGAINQKSYQRDHVWPGKLIEAMGRMASGDLSMCHLKDVTGTGLLGDGLDVMRLLYQTDPDLIPDETLDGVCTALQLDKGLILSAPWMFGGKSVGSVGLDTWRAHVIASRALGIQMDTGEGGYPTCFFLDRTGAPIFFTDPQVVRIRALFEHDQRYTITELKQVLRQAGITEEEDPEIYQVLAPYPELQDVLFYEVVSREEEAFVSTEIKTGIFGVTKESIQRARRVVIAYSQGAKMGIGGHILAAKVNKLVSYLRGIQGLESLNLEALGTLIERLERMASSSNHGMKASAEAAREALLSSHTHQEITASLKASLWQIQNHAYTLHHAGTMDPIEFEKVVRLADDVIAHVYTSVISPFPFHNCYSIEDVKAFIDIVRMINPRAVISVKVSPSVDIEFIVAGLARISQENRLAEDAQWAALSRKDSSQTSAPNPYGMRIEVWLDGPRGGTGASPNIIKGQMGMHLEYATILTHDRLVRDGLRNEVKLMVAGGVRTYEDVLKLVAFGADGVIWGTAPLVAIGCDRNRNCHDGCSRGIATSNLIMQQLRDVDLNAKQIINAFLLMQMQVIRGLAGLGLEDIRALRGRFDKVQWIGLKERVDFRARQKQEHHKHKEQVLGARSSARAHGGLPAADAPMASVSSEDGSATAQSKASLRGHELSEDSAPPPAPDPARRPTGRSNCGVAAIIGTENIPSHIVDAALHTMRNRGMDGVGVGKTLCFPEHPHHYAYRIMVKGQTQLALEEALAAANPEVDANTRRARSRAALLTLRHELAREICQVFLEPCFNIESFEDISALRESYKLDGAGLEQDYRAFGKDSTDPGDIYCFFVRVKKAVLAEFITCQLLVAPRYEYIREYFPEIHGANFEADVAFLRKAEDLYVFDHSTRLSQCLYIHEPRSLASAEPKARAIHRSKPPTTSGPMAPALEGLADLQQYFDQRPLAQFPDAYGPRRQRIAAVMSCGKNFAVWKTAGREIPWETPAAPNNIIHVRLATGSIVEQMNAHPFAKLHTALTHNGETTNYETLRQRVELFGLRPLATTDTEVAALKFHLVADELAYPIWALFEAFSPTTGDDLALVDQTLRRKLEEIQRVEFTSSPDGPYQYLCLRHLPDELATERIDLKDPADLRPSTTAFWSDSRGPRPRAFCAIASEEQAVRRVFELLDEAQIIEGQEPDRVMVSDGMVSRLTYDSDGQITDLTFQDRYGVSFALEEPGHHYSMRAPLVQTAAAKQLEAQLLGLPLENRDLIEGQLREGDFDTLRFLLHQLNQKAIEKGRGLEATEYQASQLALLTHLIDHVRGLDTGDKAWSACRGIATTLLDHLLLELTRINPERWILATREKSLELPATTHPEAQTLVVDARGFLPEGLSPQHSLAAFLGLAYDRGWRQILIFRASGHRLISPAAMGRGDTDDVVLEVYGCPGEYVGAFMQGGRCTVHGNAQNFAGMGLHHGRLIVHGNAGKVCGYASKGGEVFILGDIVDRAWTNSVNDPRCQDLKVHILGTAGKYCGESLMGGDFLFGGLAFGRRGQLELQKRPCRGTKILGGASRGRLLFFDPDNRLAPAQHTDGKLEPLRQEDWPLWTSMATELLQMANIPFEFKDGQAVLTVDGVPVAFASSTCKLLVPKGILKGYESH